jgi:DnaJ domain
MKTLYDVLGVRPDDDHEALKRAFRKAVKACHPDMHADDPDAPVRFRLVVKAYTILRDPEQRVAYEQLLELEREQLRARPRRYTARKFVFDGIAAAALAVVIAGGYALFPNFLSSARTANVLAMPWRQPAKVDAVQPAAPTDMTNQDEPRDELAGVEVLNTPAVPRELASVDDSLASAANGGDTLGKADSGPSSSGARPDSPDIQVANAIDTVRVEIDQAVDQTVDQTYAKAAADHLKRDSGIDPFDQNQVRSVGGQSSAARDNGVPGSPSYGMKPRAKKTPVRPPMLVKGRTEPAPHAPSKRVALESRRTSACPGSQSCSSEAPPVFGVGF